MVDTVHPALVILGAILGPGGAAWVAVKAALNGTREDVRELREDVRAIKGDIQQMRERIAKLEALQ